jgi:hypothetical protein
MWPRIGLDGKTRRGGHAMRLEKTTQIVARTEHNTLVLEYKNGRRKEVDPDRPGLFRWITGERPRPWRITR